MGRERKKKKKKQTTTSVSEPVLVDGCENGGDIKEAKESSNDITNNKHDTESKQYSVKDILKKVEECMDTLNFELAHKFCERALELEPDHVEALETAGAVFLETGETEKAAHCFKHAIDLSPDEGYSKYMYMGQLLTGKEAAQAFTKGIQLMTIAKDKGSQDGASSCHVNPRDISTAYCSLAEIYMTDECDDDEAETKCSEYCQKAVKSDPTNAEAYQAMANCLLSQQNTEEARKVLHKGLELWLGRDEDMDEVTIPPFEARITTAKLLLELEDFENAGQVLQTLLEENDEQLEVWYLLGLMYHLSKQDPASKKVCLEKALKIFTESGCEDDVLRAHIDELLAGDGEGTEAMNDNDDNDDDEEEEEEQMEVL